MKLVTDIIQTIADACVIFGAFFAIFQYLRQKRLTKISNAINLAKYFSSDIIDKASLVYSLFCAEKDVQGIIEAHKEDIKNAQFFNVEEYKAVFSEEERNKYERFVNTDLKLQNGRSIPLVQILQETINELEHCSISFNTRLAEENAVYQSMHQVLFCLFPCVYPWICSINDNGVDLYYTNLCELYQRWNGIREKALKKEKKAKIKLEKYTHNYNKSGRIKSKKV